MATKLTVIIPCKDERYNIRPCIESVRGIADEILVADSGSSDATLDIVRNVGGCRIIEREYVNSANFKNWAIPQATHPWILLVDADERVTESLAAEIGELLTDPPNHQDGFWILRENYFMGHRINHCGWDTDDVIRLFRRDQCRYAERVVHAEIEIDPKRAGRLRGSLEHYSVWTFNQHATKMLRYNTWAAQHLWDRGKRASVAGLLLRPWLRFLSLYFLRLGFLDGLAGLQICALTAFSTFAKQSQLWEMEYGLEQPDPEAERETNAGTVSLTESAAHMSSQSNAA